MRRIKVLALVMIMSLMLMGVGYAYWQDTITVNSTVQTGTFDVKWTNVNCQIVYPDAEKFGVNFVPQETMAVDLVGDPTGDTITATITNLYPGAGGEIQLFLENWGTVPARFQDCTITVGGADAATLGPRFVTKARVSTDGVAWTTIDNGSGDVDTSWTPITGLAALINASAAIKADAYVIDASDYDVNDALAAGDDFYIYIPFEFANQVNEAGAEIGAEELEDQTMTITFDFDFEQWVKA